MVAIAKERRLESGRNFTPGVIEPSFGIGRIIYCLLEHSFATRNGDANRVVFTFTPIIAPIRCTVFPLQQDARLEQRSQKIAASLVAAGMSTKARPFLILALSSSLLPRDVLRYCKRSLLASLDA